MSRSEPPALLAPLLRPVGNALGAGCGLAVAVVTAVFYFMDSGRSLDYDSSLTVGAFVKTGSILDPLRRQIQLNNHPLFSVLEHLVWSAGFHSETALRVLPIVFGCLTVALLTAYCAHLWGVLPGVTAGAVLATNPMFADLSRAVRGYSLLTLCGLASTLLMWRMLESEPPQMPTPARRLIEVGYVLFLAAGISTHLYGCTVVVVHAAIVAGRRRFDARWVQRWVVSGVLGSLIYLKTLNVVLDTHNARAFHSAFGREVVLSLLGQARLAAAALGIAVLGALWIQRRRVEFFAAVGAIAVFVVLVWVVVQPQFLVVRYWVWIVPGVGLAAAFLVSRRPVAIVLVVVAIAAMANHQRDTWTAVDTPTSETAAVVDAARAQGMDVCGYLHTGVAVLAYTRQPRTRAETFAEMAKCDLVVGFYVTPVVNRVEQAEFPYHWKISGLTPAFVYSRKSREAVMAGVTRPRLTLETHRRTFPS
ncbi:MAG TPA: hypothetical protein VIK61_03510 [Acidimicrobiia bacterium]